MLENFDLSTVYKRPDGSYVINRGLYHVPNEGDWADLWAEVNTYAKEHPEVVQPEPTPPEPTFEEIKTAALSRIDSATSAAILAGFEYTIDGESLHFSYDSFDQQNFADSANVATLSLSGIEGLPQSVTWNAYRHYTLETGGELIRLTLDPQAFLALYTSGALAHKAAQMEIGGQRKTAVEVAKTVEEIETLLAGWGIS